MKFIDEALIHIRSGHGGPGAVGFRREKFVPKGGPDGGNGGRGGSIIFVADRNLSTLIDFKYKRHYEAQNGARGEGQNCHGSDGEDVHIRMPVGTTLRDAHTDELLADLAQDAQTYVALSGGRGGKGNHFFRGPTRQAPQFAQPGESEQIRDIKLELKLLADVGLVGFPNAGKSTLISVLSHARPKIADYPFTTLAPNLGVVRINADRSFVMADIPGLIEGAHTGTGLGTKFLKHIQRTKFFLHLIDISQPDPIKKFDIICRELEAHDPKLLKKGQIVVLTKTDLIQNKEKIKKIAEKFKERGYTVCGISAVQQVGLKALTYAISERLFKTDDPAQI